MNLSDNNFLKEVEAFTSNPILRKNDVEKILELTIEYQKQESFEKLIFTAKYISGLIRVLKIAPGIKEVNSIDKAKNDLNENIKNGIEQLKELIYLGDKSVQEYFDQTYFTMTSQNINNLTQLFSDLESVKKYINHLKRKY
jgi:hypothetical protein